jgi:alcohol dehydrogenase class IV
MNEFQCRVPKILFGSGRFGSLGEIASEWGRRVFLALDPYIDESEIAESMLDLLQEASISAVRYSKIEPDPDCFSVDEAGKVARKNACTAVIAVGGGSAIDFGKGVAVVAANPGTCWQYTRRKDHIPKNAGPGTLPVIAVPTTAGTGSEATHFAVFTNPDIREKSTIVSDRIIPRAAVVDPELTFSCPPELTALTGVDVLAHSVEAFINTTASPFARMVAIEAVALVGRYLVRAVRDGEDREARENMAWASTLAGIAIAHSNPTLPHALGQAAGGFIHAPHGASIAACLPHIIRLSYDADAPSFAELAVALDPSSRDLPSEQRAERSADLFARLFEDIDLKVRFSDLGLKPEDIPRVAQIALTGYFTGISLHPKQMDAAQIEEIYRACL